MDKTLFNKMFIGEFHHKLDNKGRMAIPAKFRDVLKNGAVITRGLDSCLTIYPKNNWLILAEKLSSLPIVKSNSRAFARFMLSGATEINLDKQGRVLVPEYLREYSMLKKEIIIVGLFDKIEIWPKSRWAKYRDNTEKKSSQIAEKLGEIENI